MSRIDDLRNRHKMMVLNEDILDAIRNRKYSLKHTPGPERSKSATGRRRNATENGGDDNIIAKILERRLRMEYQTDAEEEGSTTAEEDNSDDCSNNSVRESWQPSVTSF